MLAAITKEDLEFSVGSKTSVWEVKDPLLPVRVLWYCSCLPIKEIDE